MCSHRGVEIESLMTNKELKIRGGLAMLMGVILALFTSLTHAQAIASSIPEPFVIGDIRIEGLQRIAPGSVFAALPVGVGDLADTYAVRAAAKSLFATGNFDDIALGRDGDVLVITVAERPSISQINIDGNKAIETDALLDGLKGAGLAVGQVFQRSTLEGMQLELQRQYVLQGRYDANIETEVIPEPRNRVSIEINVDEGTVATISHINIVGNSVYSDEELKELFELKSSGGWFSFFSSDDKYSKEKLTSDLETLSSFYLDRGYLQFNIDSTQVAVSPTKESVFITANVTEGEIFTVSDVALTGDLVLPEEDLSRFLLVREGQIYSQQLVTSTEEFLTRRLGNEGYNFAEVTGIPEVNEDDSTVEMKFFVDPGKRTYVRRINFSGNVRTSDDVLRREMRQMESSPASQAAIEQSRVRLDRLGFFKETQVDTVEVPGHDDLVDVNFTVEEQSFGSIGGSLGYAQAAGLILGLNFQQNNFMGSGRYVGVNVSSSRYQDAISLNYSNPYFTEDGVSRGWSVFYRKTDLSEINVASYTTDTVGASINFGYPISETQRLGFSFGVSDTQITAGRYAVQEIKASPRFESYINRYFVPTILEEGSEAPDNIQFFPLDSVLETYPNALTNAGNTGFLDENGDQYLNYTATLTWLQSTLNRGQLATRGMSNSLSLEVAVPTSDLEYYKLNYRGELYLPIYNEFVLHLRTDLGYGDGYGSTSRLPFYQHFFAGGFGSVRGFEANTLGPRSTPPLLYSSQYLPNAVDENGDVIENGAFGYVINPDTGKLQVQSIYSRPDPFGGNVLIEGTAEILFPMPFIEDRSQLRSAFFLDAGNVFNTQCGNNQINCFGIDFGEIRYSYGIGVTWLSGFGPLTFSIAKPVNASDFDEREVFQFTLGRGF